MSQMVMQQMQKRRTPVNNTGLAMQQAQAGNSQAAMARQQQARPMAQGGAAMAQAQAPRTVQPNYGAQQQAMARQQQPRAMGGQAMQQQQAPRTTQPNYGQQQQAMAQAQQAREFQQQQAMQRQQQNNGFLPGESYDQWFARMDQQNGVATTPNAIDTHTTMSAAQAASNAANDPFGDVQDWSDFNNPRVQQYWNENREPGAIYPWDNKPTGSTPQQQAMIQAQQPRATTQSSQATTFADPNIPRGQDVNFGYNTQMGMMDGSEFAPSNPLAPPVSVKSGEGGLVDQSNYTYQRQEDLAQGQQGTLTQQDLMNTLNGQERLAWQDNDYSTGYDAAGDKAGGFQDLRSTIDPTTGAVSAPTIATAIDIANAEADPTQQFGRANKSGLEGQIGQSIDNLTIDKQEELQREQDMITQQFQQQREQLARMYATDPSGINSGDAQRQFEVLASQEAMAKSQAYTSSLQRIREEERANIGTMLQTQQSLQQGDLAARADYLQQKGLELEAAKYQESTRQFDETLKQQVAQFAQQYGLDQTQANAMVDQTYAAINARNKELDANIDQMQAQGKLDYAKFNMSADQFKATVQQQELSRQTDIAQFSMQFGLDASKFEQAINESDRQFALANEQAANQYGLDVAQFELAQWKMRDDAQARDTAREDAVTQFAQQFNLDAGKFNMALADTQAKWEQTNRETAQKFGMDEANFMLARQDMQERYRLQEQAQKDQRDQFADSFGLDKDKFNLAMVEADRAWKLSSEEQAHKFDMDADQFALARAEFENKVEMGNLTFEQASEEAARAYNLDVTKFKQATVEAGKQYELEKGQIAQNWQLDQQKFGLAEAQFNSDKNFRQQEQLQIQDASAKQYGLDVAKFNQAVSESDRNMDLQERNNAQQYGLDVNQFNLAKYQAEQASVAAFKDLDLRATTTAQQYGLQKDQFNRAIQESDRTFKLTEAGAIQQMGIEYSNWEQAKASFDKSEAKRDYLWSMATKTPYRDSGLVPEWISGDQHMTLAGTLATGQQYNVGQGSGGGVWGAIGNAAVTLGAARLSRPVG